MEGPRDQGPKSPRKYGGRGVRRREGGGGGKERGGKGEEVLTLPIDSKVATQPDSPQLFFGQAHLQRGSNPIASGEDQENVFGCSQEAPPRQTPTVSPPETRTSLLQN